jgi:hypothetical protein
MRVCKLFFCLRLCIARQQCVSVYSVVGRSRRGPNLEDGTTNRFLSEAYHRRLDGVAYSTYILIMLLVPLKVYCRKRSGGWQNVRLDDYMTILALALANGFFYTCIIGTLLNLQ